MTAVFLMIPNGYASAMSCRDIGGTGPPPRDNNQLPPHGSQSVQSVRRKLFGDVDHQQTSLDLQRELKECEERDRKKYNFDFISEEPIDCPEPRFEWSEWSQLQTHSKANDSEPKPKPKDKLSKQQFSTKPATQSQSAVVSVSATTSSPETPTGVCIVSPSSASTAPTSATIAPDSQPQPSSSVVELSAKVGQKQKLVNPSKQSTIPAFFDSRKSAESQRKRSAAQVVSHKDRLSKRQRLECTSAVRPEDSDTTSTDVTDTGKDMSTTATTTNITTTTGTPV